MNRNKLTDLFSKYISKLEDENLQDMYLEESADCIYSFFFTRKNKKDSITPPSFKQYKTELKEILSAFNIKCSIKKAEKDLLFGHSTTYRSMKKKANIVIYYDFLHTFFHEISHVMISKFFPEIKNKLKESAKFCGKKTEEGIVQFIAWVIYSEYYRDYEVYSDRYLIDCYLYRYIYKHVSIPKLENYYTQIVYILNVICDVIEKIRRG